jgi:ABC-type Co2+ transport system permease subunit
MSFYEKLALTWSLLLIPIFLYGLLDIKQGKENRWVLIGIWLAAFFIGAIYRIWI